MATMVWITWVGPLDALMVIQFHGLIACLFTAPRPWGNHRTVLDLLLQHTRQCSHVKYVLRFMHSHRSKFTQIVNFIHYTIHERSSYRNTNVPYYLRTFFDCMPTFRVRTALDLITQYFKFSNQRWYQRFSAIIATLFVNISYSYGTSLWATLNIFKKCMVMLMLKVVPCAVKIFLTG